MGLKFKLYKDRHIVYFGDMDKEEHKIVLQDREAPKPINPAVWLGLLAIPLVFGLLIGLVKTGPDAPIEKPQPGQGISAEQAAAASSRRGRGTHMSASNPVIAPTTQAQNKSYKCDFPPWVGGKVSNEMLNALKGAGRPYRVLEPGSMMTMDHSPARVNFDVDKAGIITRIWCG